MDHNKLNFDYKEMLRMTNDNELYTFINNQLTKAHEFENELCERYKDSSNRSNDAIILFMCIDTYYNELLSNTFILMCKIRNIEESKIKDIQKLFREYLLKFYMNKELFILLSRLTKDDSDIDEHKKSFISKIILERNRYLVNRKYVKITSKIDEYKHRIEDKLTTFKIINAKTTKLTHNSCNVNNKGEMLLTPSNYINYITNLTDDKLRNLTNADHNEQNSRILNDFAKIVILKHDFANQVLSKYNIDGTKKIYSFHSYKNQEEIVSIKNMIHELSSCASNKVNIELERINMKNNGVTNMYDILYYKSQNYPNIIFKLSHILKILLDMCYQYFQLKISKIDDENTYSIKSNEFIIGYVNINLKCKNKALSKPIYIKISEKYKLHNKLTLSRGYLLGHYDDDIKYDDVINIYREFGHVIQYSIYESEVGLSNKHIRNNSFYPSIMEYIAYDPDNILLCTENQNNVDKLIKYLDIDRGIKIQQKCINVLFDLQIHSNVDTCAIIKEGLLNREVPLKLLYFCICKEINKNINYDVPDPAFIMSLLNGHDTYTYFSLVLDISAYCVYYILKHKKNADEFKNVMKNCYGEFGDIINVFLSKYNYSPQELYLKNVLKYSQELLYTESTNKFTG